MEPPEASAQALSPEARIGYDSERSEIKVDVVLVVADEEQAEPRVEGIDGHNEQDADDVALLVGDGVGPKVDVKHH
ncbi:hypothetical protein EYF80_021715 [Liparis tanakae]|uniref:Uncharacterized protein n=1 Tax=Liparis tanakae TaxID=230148 RepID=A0A4Z2HR08_9TELE|nr:hypothetical protein EYF80_021715 [Liparis tanakae]